MTLNEVREREQLPPVPHGDVVANPTYVGYLNQQNMMAMQQQGAGGAAPPPSGGEEPGPEEKRAKGDVLKVIGGKGSGESSEDTEHKPDRHYQPDEDWEETYNASLTNDLKKATEPLNALADIDNW